MPPEQIAELSKRRLRQRIPELTEALRDHHLNDHHRFLIAQSVEHAVLLDRQMEQLEALIEEKLQPYQQQYELLQTIPGVKDMTAASILAEIGPDMSQFDSAKKLGRNLPREQPIRGQEEAQPDEEGEQISDGRARAGKLGGRPKTRLDLSAQVSSLDA
jgi:hypothetical protein